MISQDQFLSDLSGASRDAARSLSSPDFTDAIRHFVRGKFADALEDGSITPERSRSMISRRLTDVVYALQELDLAVSSPIGKLTVLLADGMSSGEIAKLIVASGKAALSRMISGSGPRLSRFESEDMSDTEYFLRLIRRVGDITDLVIKFVAEHRQALEDAAEAEVGAPLGRIAFATRRKGMPLEPDTDLEVRLFRELVAHFSGETYLSPGTAKIIQDMLSDGLYSSVLREPPPGTVLYRGISTTKAWIRRSLGTGGDIPENGMSSVSYKFTPKLVTSSWTTDRSVALKFARTSAETKGHEARIVMHAVVDEPHQFVLGPGGLYDVAGLDRYRDEMEAIGFGTIRVSKIQWTL